MKHFSVIAGSLFILFVGCTNVPAVTKPTIEIEVANFSTDDLENTEVHFDENLCKLGTVVKNTSASFMNYPDPIGTHAELCWDAVGSHQIKKIDLRNIYHQGASGVLTFAVYEGRVEVTFRKR